MTAHYVTLHQRLVVHVQSTRAWECWQQNKHVEIFHDLRDLITWDQKQRIRVLCINARQLTDMPNNEWSLRNRMMDATKAAREVALSLQPLEKEKELRAQDQRYKRIAPQAIQRIKHLLSDKQHFLNEARETGKQKRDEARTEKQEALTNLTHHTAPGKHAWMAKGKGVQCSKCKCRLTMHSQHQEILAGKDEACADNPQPPLVGGEPTSQTKQEFLQQMIQGQIPNMAPHGFVEATNYISCDKCHVKLLKNPSKEKLLELAHKQCWNQHWSPEAGWKGHSSHKLWRRGGKLWCVACKAHALTTPFRASKALQNQCKSHELQTTLPVCFRQKADHEPAA